MGNYEYFFTEFTQNGMNLMSVDSQSIKRVLNNYRIKIAYYGECGSSICFPFEIDNTITTIEDFRGRFYAERHQVDYIDNHSIILKFFDCRLKSIFNIKTKYNFILILEEENE